MQIAVIGGGMTGLTAAYRLAASGHRVDVFEKEPYLGGLAYGFTKDSWDWHIEGAYHHLFTNDAAILSLLQELGHADDILTLRPVTASLFRDTPYQLDSPYSLLTFPGLSVVSKLRTAFLLGLLKITPVWQPFEAITAEHLLTTIGGEEAFRTIWKPLLYGKFGNLAPEVAASWFWARIKKRTPHLIYIRGGFHTAVTALKQAIEQSGGRIHTGTAVSSVRRTNNTYTVSWKKTGRMFDAVVLTVPTPLVTRIMPELPEAYVQPLTSIPHLFAQTLIVETDKPILHNVYWLNITDTSFPFLAAVAHTNFVRASRYGGRHLTYFGNYLPAGHRYL